MNILQQVILLNIKQIKQGKINFIL